MRKIKPWMFVYLVFFIGLTFFSVKNDAENHYPIIYIFLGSFAYMVFNAGIVLFALGVRHEVIKRTWRYLFPYLIAYFVTSFVIDSIFGMYADLRPQGILLDIAVFILGIIIFFPAFRASFVLAYKPIMTVQEQN